jgi:hypothetical protein
MEAICELHAPAASPLKKGLRYSLDIRLGRSQSWYARCREEKIVEYRDRNSEPSVVELYPVGAWVFRTSVSKLLTWEKQEIPNEFR